MSYLLSRFLTILLFLWLIDYLSFRAVKIALRDTTKAKRKLWFWGYWLLSGLCFLSVALYFFGIFRDMSPMRVWVQGIVSVLYISKFFVVFFVLFEDFVFFVRKLSAFFSGKLYKTSQKNSEGKKITRAKFIHQVAIAAGAIPAVTLSWGIISGAHDYRVRRRKIYLPHLPKSFEGFTIAQISDIHAGSFYNKTAVQGGVEMLLAEKPHLILFTGDLINNHPDEMREYIDVFAKFKADFGVYSVMGNHDYADYIFGISTQERVHLRKKLHQIHKTMQWNLLLDENKYIEQGGEKIAIIGVQNWGTGNFPKYGNLAKAYRGTEEASVKILLSHDPSHWDAQIRPHFPDIDLTLSGHTHGMQLGIEYGDFRWSPVQYRYKQWADLYQEKNQQNRVQYLYVNRGFGYIGYLGRVGILPEITILVLTRYT